MSHVSYLAFHMMWAQRMGWDLPDIHVVACDWLEKRGDLAVLMMARGHAKSTLLGTYNAWRYYVDHTYRILHQGDQDKTARKTSRDTKFILMHHPLTKHLEVTGEVDFWNVVGNPDARNPSMQAAGILSNITSSRADEIQNDDVEVQKNVQTPEAREKMRFRLSEQVHILVPGGRTLFVGTPHTHDSIYDQQIALGADLLRIPMFGQETRVENAKPGDYACAFEPVVVFLGIGRNARALERGVDFSWDDGTLTLARGIDGLVDAYADIAWPERFTVAEITKRRRRCETINTWDAQYQLHSKPVKDIRLDPARLTPYSAEPTIRKANGSVGMFLGTVQIVAASLRWDPSSGRVGRDTSALVLVLQDAAGKRYWHRAAQLIGEVAEFGPDGKLITGGQVFQIAQLVEQFQLPRVVLETNGIGQFAPAILKACLRQRRLNCAVIEATAKGKKNERILGAFEPMLKTGGQLWAHIDVIRTVWDQMADWNPMVVDQPDDYLDATASALMDAPERIGRVVGNSAPKDREDWAPTSGTFEVSYSRR